jgi:lipocalin
MKMTDETIAPARPMLDLPWLVEQLDADRGRWAEVARYPESRRKSAWSRGSQTVARYPKLEYAVNRDGDEYVLYFRIPA